ncbi:MAG: hypothetical protein WBA45_07840 [Microthrixaceae bacterium]
MARPDGRTRLLDAAEVLLDTAGIDGTTGAAITAAAGHRNAAAVNYHFGNLDQLIIAVLDRRSDELNTVRHRLLDELESAGPISPRAAFGAMIDPLANLLNSFEGRRYLRLLNQAANHPRFHSQASWQYATSVERGAVYLAPLVQHMELERQRHRARNVLGLVLYALAEQARTVDDATVDDATDDLPLLTTEVFVSDLTNAALAALAA